MAELISFLAFKNKKEEINFSDKIDYNKLTKLRCLVDNLISQTIDNYSPEAYSEEEKKQYNLVNSLNDALIIGWINNFNEEKVIAEPLFYSALINVAMNRELIRSNFNG
ncbi:MAG: hypothetical protein WCV70_02145 [Patescibacteria group bacterium]|jgi:hypothetical protein